MWLAWIGVAVDLRPTQALLPAAGAGLPPLVRAE